MSEARSGPPRIVVVGAVTEDRFGGTTRPGGAVLYAARGLEALGIRARVLASALPGSEPEALDPHERTFVRTSTGLRFGIEIDGEERHLRVLSRPDRALTADDLPAAWRAADALILAPLLPDDLDAASFLDQPVSRISLVAQGFQRQVSPTGDVTLLDAPAPALLAAATARTSVFLSREEVAAWPGEAIEDLVAACARVVVTRGANGADVHHAGEEPLHIDAAPASPVDTTGAGDAFAAAFTAALACGASEARAGALAARVAAATVEHVGPVRLPRLAMPEGVTG